MLSLTPLAFDTLTSLWTDDLTCYFTKRIKTNTRDFLPVSAIPDPLGTGSIHLAFLSLQRMNSPVSSKVQVYIHAWIPSLLPSQGLCSCNYILFLGHHSFFLQSFLPIFKDILKSPLTKSPTLAQISHPLSGIFFSHWKGFMFYIFIPWLFQLQAFISSMPLKSFLLRLQMVSILPHSMGISQPWSHLTC